MKAPTVKQQQRTKIVLNYPQPIFARPPKNTYRSNKKTQISETKHFRNLFLKLNNKFVLLLVTWLSQR